MSFKKVWENTRYTLPARSRGPETSSVSIFCFGYGFIKPTQQLPTPNPLELVRLVIHILFWVNQVKLSSQVYFENAFGALKSNVKKVSNR